MSQRRVSLVVHFILPLLFSLSSEVILGNLLWNHIISLALLAILVRVLAHPIFWIVVSPLIMMRRRLSFLMSVRRKLWFRLRNVG